jgi:hypothetical protein
MVQIRREGRWLNLLTGAATCCRQPPASGRIVGVLRREFITGRPFLPESRPAWDGAGTRLRSPKHPLSDEDWSATRKLARLPRPSWVARVLRAKRKGMALSLTRTMPRKFQWGGQSGLASARRIGKRYAPHCAADDGREPRSGLPGRTENR